MPGGFTLVEILISIGIFALGMTGVLSMFWAATRAHRQAMDNVEVALLAQELVTQYAAAVDNSTDGSGNLIAATAFDTKNIIGTGGSGAKVIYDGKGQVDARFADDGFVMSANYPKLWYSVILRDVPEPDLLPPGAGAVRLIVKITGYPGSPGAGDQAQRFETVLLRKPRQQTVP
jgi:prepilin-type N-terminal cleavage/methylation domain-containing protein